MTEFEFYIYELVDAKVIQLKHLDVFGFESGRYFYETSRIESQIFEFDCETKELYLNRLSEQIITNDIAIYDFSLGQLNITEKILQWIKIKLSFLGKNDESNDLKINPHTRIFKPGPGFDIFESYMKDKKDSYVEYCFIYHAMKKKCLMWDIEPKEYIAWLDENKYTDLNGRWKQYDRCTPKNKQANFELLLETYKLN